LANVSFLKRGVMLPLGLAIAACAVASLPALTDTATPQATRTPVVIASPIPSATSEELPGQSPTPSPQSAALPVCRKPSDIEPSELTLAFLADWDGDFEVYFVQANGSELVQVTDNATSDNGPKWSPDGSQLALIDNFVWLPRLMVSDADGSNATIIAPEMEVSSDLVWSPTGRQIVFRSVHDLFAVDVVTGAAVNLTRGLTADLPSFSPDGDWMVIPASLPDSAGPPEHRLFTVRADGTELTELSFPIGEADWPTWHPVRDEILFQGEVQGQGVDLYVASLDGSTRSLGVDPEYFAARPTWSSDGTMIAYIVRNTIRRSDGSVLGKHSLRVISDNESIDVPVLLPPEGEDEGLVIADYLWAPDSRRIAYVNRIVEVGRNQADLYALDICTGITTPAAHDIAGFDSPSFRPVP
jgi:TolB protein